MNSLIALSGGLDSTYVLWKTLATTTDQVTAIFLTWETQPSVPGQFFPSFVSTQKIIDDSQKKYNLKWNENAYVNMKQSVLVQNITQWLKKNVRDFTLDVQIIDPVRFNLDKINHTNTYFIDLAIERINAGVADKIICAHEKENDGWSNGGTKNGVRRSGSMECYDRFVADAKRGEISFPLLDQPYTQANALAVMPKELVDLSSSCIRDPSNSCGACFKCKKRQFFCDEIASGKTVEEIVDFVKSKSIQPDGKWVSMKSWLGEMNSDPFPTPQWPTSYKVL
jgi:7-cyano-7-deazaguanine synthase in queuosine biosynthesis